MKSIYFILITWLTSISSFWHPSFMHLHQSSSSLLLSGAEQPKLVRSLSFDQKISTQRLFGRPRKNAQIVSPFDPSNETPQALPTETLETPLDLTEENVQIVLEELRPMLQGDGGDVKFVEIDGNTVKIELCGNCVSCASSSMTLKMGIERKLRQRITGVKEVIQVMPDAPDVTEKNVEKVLSGVRPFLSIAGGTVNAVRILKMGKGMPSIIVLKMEGNSKALHSVKMEIVQRLQKFFVQPMNIQWVEN